ncbi:hypothetical protein [uncultured Sphingomonas sp.]|uniref:hypothetical protein n=1 Tax=uncultured Sphingomonas sp. TaxID=158754 RepID=UPI002596A773|nr:hypothetical protein [uncultured Sphingomonas sp.]
MSSEPGMRCANCFFWDNEVPVLANGTRRPRGADPQLGTCHARPPEATRSAGFPMPLFPETHADRFCGSWQPCGQAGGPDDGERATDNVIPIGRASA